MEKEMLNALREAFLSVRSMSYTEFLAAIIDPEIDSFVEDLHKFGLLPKKSLRETKVKISIYQHAMLCGFSSYWTFDDSSILKFNKSIAGVLPASSPFSQKKYSIRVKSEKKEYIKESYYSEPQRLTIGEEYAFG